MNPAPRSRRDLRVALLGDGSMAGEHATVLAELDCPAHVVLGAQPAKVRGFADRHHIERWTTSLDQVIGDPQVDAVIIASPNDQHSTQIIAAATGGKHVLCEVPLATSLPDATTVADRAATAGVAAMVCQTQRYLPAVTRLRLMRESRQLDPLQVVSITGLRRRQAENIGWHGMPRDWVDSLIWHHGSHALDTALWLLADSIQSVRAGTARPDPGNGLPLDVSICVETRSGRLATLTLSYSARPTVNELLVIAEEGTHWVSNGVWRDDPGTAAPADPAASHQAFRAALTAQDRTFIEAARGRELPLPTPADLLPMFELLADVERQVESRLANLLGP
jgi:2-hydroxy-4-carboxymuconate semialdehyde hemiacetal dehydrogenase